MKVTDVLGCACSASVLLFISAWVPIFGPFFSLLIPLPFLYYTSKSGLNQGVMIVVITLLTVVLIAKLMGFPEVLFLCLEFGLLGLIISEIYKRGYTFGFTIFWGTSLMLILGSIMLVLIGLTQNMGPLELILNYFQANLKETIHSYDNMGWDQEKILQLEEYSKVLVRVISKVYPSLMIVGTGLVVWINVVVSKPLFRFGNLKYPEFGPMDRWRTPEHMVWGVIAAGFSLFLPIAGVKLFAMNALIVMMTIYVFHGLSIVIFFLNKYRVPPWIRFGVYFLIIFQQIFLVGLAMAGLFDQWVDFRKIHRRRSDDRN
jgi:uncharacterized protein YybS (DUF2232 family)